MSVREQIENGLIKAMHDKNELELSVFRLLKSAVKNAEIEKKSELSDDEIMAVVEKQAKQRRDSIDQYEKGGREDLAAREKEELDLIEKFLPEKMGDDEIRTVVKNKIVEAGEGADFGRVMGMVMTELKGKADGSVVQRLVQEELK
jgi:uncharacterized protein